jgi:hypothetical protein
MKIIAKLDVLGGNRLVVGEEVGPGEISGAEFYLEDQCTSGSGNFFSNNKFLNLLSDMF